MPGYYSKRDFLAQIFNDYGIKIDDISNRDLKNIKDENDLYRIIRRYVGYQRKVSG